MTAPDSFRDEERWTFRVLRVAMIELADLPLDDELQIARARQRVAEAKANWATALRVLDGAGMPGQAATGGR